MSQLYNKRTKRYFDMAKTASHRSDFNNYKLGAVVIYRGGLLAMGYNSTKTSPVQKKYNRMRGYDVEASDVQNSVHAEVSCLSKIKYLDIDFSKVTLYVYREHKNGTKAMARPCPACRKMIKDMGIKEVWFTTEDGYGYEYMEG